MATAHPNSHNPLVSFMRQPKIYIRLPSSGEYWPNNSLIASEIGEYPIFSMTAKDELMLKILLFLFENHLLFFLFLKNFWLIQYL